MTVQEVDGMTLAMTITFPKWNRSWIGYCHACILKNHMLNQVLYWGSWPWKKRKVHVWAQDVIVKCSPTARSDSWEGLELITTSVIAQKMVKFFLENPASNSLIAKFSDATNALTL